MIWTRIGAEFWQSPGMLAVDRDARLVHLEAMTWCNAHGTDGQVPKHAMRRITDSLDPDGAIAQLITAGEWESTETGWKLVRFLDEQPAAATVQGQRADARNRKDKFNRRQKLHGEGDHSECMAYTVCRQTWDRTRSERVPNAPPSDRPTDRPIGREKDGRQPDSADSAGATPAPSSAEEWSYTAEVAELPDYLRIEIVGPRNAFGMLNGFALAFEENIINQFGDDSFSEARRENGKSVWTLVAPIGKVKPSDLFEVVKEHAIKGNEE